MHAIRNPKVEALENREVPSATLDLTARGSSGAINGAEFVQFDARPTGTGVIDSFVRVQALGNTSSEQGYNTSARPLHAHRRPPAGEGGRPRCGG